MDAVVDSHAKGVEEPLHVAGAETGEDATFFIRPAVAVGVAEEEDVGSVAHKHPASPAADRRGPGKPLSKHLGPVGAAIAIVVEEQPDPPQPIRFVFAVAPHFADEEPAVLIPVDRHWAGKHWLGSDQREREAVGHLHRAQGVARRHRRNPGQVFSVVCLAWRWLGGHQAQEHQGPAHKRGHGPARQQRPPHGCTSKSVCIAAVSASSACGPTDELRTSTS